MHLVAEEAVDRGPCFSLAALTVHRMLKSTPWARRPASPPSPCRKFHAAGDRGGRRRDLARTIDAEADQEVMFLEERPPGVVEQDAVGLEGVLNGLVWLANSSTISSERRKNSVSSASLATLPGDRHFRRAVGSSSWRMYWRSVASLIRCFSWDRGVLGGKKQ